jgi:SAM-dependent methyltransferase
MNSLKKIARRILRPSNPIYSLLYTIFRPGQALQRRRMLRSRSSIFNDEEQLGGCSLEPIPLLKGCLEIFGPASILDVGCGTGKSLDWFLSQGIDVLGMEGSEIAIQHARNPDRIRHTNLNEAVDLQRTFDLVWCFEVAEHIHPDFTDTFVQTLTHHSTNLVMSAAHLGQGGIGHFNEQPREYWIAKLNEHGYQHDDAARDRLVRDWTWYPENLFVFRKKPLGDASTPD